MGGAPNQRDIDVDVIKLGRMVTTGCKFRYRLFEVNRDGVSVRLLSAFSGRWRCVRDAAGPGCRRCGRACGGSRGCEIRMPGGLRAWRAGSGFRRWRSSAPSSAPDVDDGAVLPRVRVVHPFHPWSGREFEFVQRRRTWDVDRVFFRVPGGDVMSLPAAWTDTVAPDPFVAVAGGGVRFRTADLLAAADLVARLRGRRSAAAGSVNGIMS